MIGALATKLQAKMYMPDEYIMREGIVGTSMYFIQRGTVVVVKGMGTATPHEIGTLSEGNFFGEVALTSAGNTRRNASVISHTVLWLQRLNKVDVYEIGRIEPLLLYTLRRVSIARRRELGEEVRSAATAFAQDLSAHRVVDKMQHRPARWRVLKAKPANMEGASDEATLQRKPSVKGLGKVMVTLRRRLPQQGATVAPGLTSEVSTTSADSPTAQWTCATPKQRVHTASQPSGEAMLSPQWDDDYGPGSDGAGATHTRVGFANDDVSAVTRAQGDEPPPRASFIGIEKRTSEEDVTAGGGPARGDSMESLHEASEEDEVSELMSLVGELAAQRERLAEDSRRLEQLESHVSPTALERPR